MSANPGDVEACDGLDRERRAFNGAARAVSGGVADTRPDGGLLGQVAITREMSVAQGSRSGREG